MEFAKTIPDNGFDCMAFEDEIDAAIIGDEGYEDAIEDIEANGVELTPDDEEEFVDDSEDLVDVKQDYSEDISEPDSVSIDADDILAAERELMSNPFEEDETIDVAIGEDI